MFLYIRQLPTNGKIFSVWVRFNIVIFHTKTVEMGGGEEICTKEGKVPQSKVQFKNKESW